MKKFIIRLKARFYFWLKKLKLYRMLKGGTWYKVYVKAGNHIGDAGHCYWENNEERFPGIWGSSFELVAYENYNRSIFCKSKREWFFGIPSNYYNKDLTRFVYENFEKDR